MFNSKNVMQTKFSDRVHAIHAFNDNYIWAISADVEAITTDSINNRYLALVDPGDADVCIEYIKQHQLILSSILITHHHRDHVGGIKKLLEYSKMKDWQVTVYGPKNEDIDLLDITLVENDVINLTTLGCQFNVLDLPGHTKGHIAYHNDEVVFCGDTIFSGGCGRLFEGTPAQMLASLTKLTNLPEETIVYCAHEYTQENLNFALTVEPDNADLSAYAKEVTQLRNENKATIPSNIKLERNINPFLRVHLPSIQQSAQIHSGKPQPTDLDVFTVIRQWKDNF